MPYTVYKVTNLVTQDFYIGVHKTDDPNDAYLGSGKVIREQVARYGPENFQKVILHSFDKRKEAYRLEAELVNPLLGTPGCLNLHPGGHGGFGYINARGLCDRARLCQLAVAGRQKRAAEDPAYREMRKRVWVGLLDKRDPVKLRESAAKGAATWKGQQHTDASKQAMSEAHQGARNSQFGTCWVTKDGLNRKIPQGDLPQFEADGWTRGRTIQQTPEALAQCAAMGRQWNGHARACKKQPNTTVL